MKPEVWNSRERFTAAEQTARVLLFFVNHVQIEKKAYSDFNVCYWRFSKFSKKGIFFLKMRKKSASYQISNVWCFFKSPGPVCKHMHLNLIKNAPRNIFSPKTLIFTFLNPKNVKSELSETQNYAYWYARFFPGTHDFR